MSDDSSSPVKTPAARREEIVWEQGFLAAIELLRDEAHFEDYFKTRAHEIGQRSGLDEAGVRTLVLQLPTFFHSQLLAQYLEDSPDSPA